MILSMAKRCFRENRLLCVYYNELIKGRKTLFFIHDLTGSALNWQKQFRAFSDHYNIITCDLYGHGLSGQPRKVLDCEMIQSVFDAQSIIEYYELESITIVACGYGALISLLLCEAYPQRVIKQLLVNPMVYESKTSIPWYLYQPFSWFYRLLRLKRSKLTQLGNNTAYLPKLWVVKAYYRALVYHLPKLEKKLSQVKPNTHVLRSAHYTYAKQERIDSFYRLFYRAKIKPLESNSYFPMQQAPKRVNYFLQQYVDELNIKAFRNLVFEGAGVRGIAYSGAITALESLGVLKNIKRFAGTSAGAIYAIFLALGHDAKEIRQIVASIDYRDFMDASRNFLSNSTRLLTDYGWYKGDDFIAQMQQFVANKVGNSDISFKALQAQTGNELFIIGTNLTRSCAEVYCTENTPDMPILEALRISTCIPILFKAVKRKDGRQEDILVDGGLTWNCPLELFDEEEYIYNPLNKQYLIEANTQQLYNQETLGFRLDPLKDPLVSMRTQPQAYKKIGNILEYTKEFMKFYTASSLKRHLEPENWKRVIFVDTLDIMGTDFEIESSQIESLIEQGRSGVYQHFAWRMSENGVKFPQ